MSLATQTLLHQQDKQNINNINRFVMRRLFFYAFFKPNY
nr:MAG TPA: hypothetical protein [Caudoviricetes sp.]